MESHSNSLESLIPYVRVVVPALCLSLHIPSHSRAPSCRLPGLAVSLGLHALSCSRTWHLAVPTSWNAHLPLT